MALKGHYFSDTVGGLSENARFRVRVVSGNVLYGFGQCSRDRPGHRRLRLGAGSGCPRRIPGPPQELIP